MSLVPVTVMVSRLTVEVEEEEIRYVLALGDSPIETEKVRSEREDVPLSSKHIPSRETLVRATPSPTTINSLLSLEHLISAVS